MLGLITLALALVAPQTGTGEVTVDGFRYSSSQEIRTTWRPMAQTPALSAERMTIRGRGGIQLPLVNPGMRARSYWDRSVNLDLRSADRISLRLYVENPKFIRGFTLYLKSGDGWYFSFVELKEGWNEIELDKNKFQTEDGPNGWGNISTIRLSLWKQKAGTTNVLIESIRWIRDSIVVVHGSRTPPSHPDRSTVDAQPNVVLSILKRAGISAAVSTDHEIERGGLVGRDIAIFPFNPHISTQEAKEIEQFTERGGKVITFYSSDVRLLGVLGLEPGRYWKQRQTGDFALIQLNDSTIPGLPSHVYQASWNIKTAIPIGNSAKEIGIWLDSSGRSIGHAALHISNTGAYMSHLLLQDDLLAKEKLMRALIGKFDSRVWKSASENAIAKCQQIGEYNSLEDTQFAVLASGNQEARAIFREAAGTLRLAERRASQNQHPEAVELAEQALQQLSAAYSTAQESKPNEMRAVWCHSEAGVPGMSWDSALLEVKKAGFNMVLPNMLWGGVAFYDSDVLPRSTDRIDYLAECVAAAKKHGVDVHVWKVSWNLNKAPQQFRQQMIREQRVQYDPQGKMIDWLCPSHPANFALERDAMLEVVRKYDVAGIHFDYIRYPSSAGCFCDGCHERFEQQYNVNVEIWPQDAISGNNKQDYLEFRRSNITRLVKAVSEEARKIKPQIKISAAVFRNWPDCRDTVGQDWVAWVKAGYLDFVCPMDYTDDPDTFQTMVATQLQATQDKIAMLPGIGVSSSASTLRADQVIQQIKIARAQNTAGFTLFNLNSHMIRNVFPYLSMGVTSDTSSN